MKEEKITSNNRLLDLFWQLAEGEDKKRNDATEKMITILIAKQKEEEEPCKELEYATKRLVKGLASNRKLARVGFATTLCQLLRTFPIVTTSYILDAMYKELKITSDQQKSEISHIMLGRIVGYITLIQSGTLCKSSVKEISEVIRLLMAVRAKKVVLHQLCVEAICQVAACLPSDLFKASVWGHLKAELSGGWKDSSPDTILLLLKIKEHHSSLVGKEFLAQHWNGKKIICEKNFQEIEVIMKKSTEDHPLIHNVCRELVKEAMEKPELFEKFWTQVISDKLITQTMERRYLGFQLIVLALKNTSLPSQVKVILTDTVVKAIITNLSNKNRPLHAPIKKLCDDLLSVVRESGDGDIQLAIITPLLCQPSTVLFDAITNTKYIHSFTSKLNDDGWKKWTALMMDLIRGKTETPFGDFVFQPQEEIVQFALAELMRSITVPGLAKQDDWHLTLLQFLALYGFFNITEDVPDIAMCQMRVGEPLSDQSRANIRAALYKALDRMATYQVPGERSRKQMGPYIDMVYQVTEYIQSLIASDGKVVIHAELAPLVLVEWNKVMTAVSEIRSKHISGTKMGEGHAFQLLFMSLGLQLFSQPKDAIDIIDDLHVCYKKAFMKKRRMSMKPAAEPEWVEVVTEMLLSLISQGSHLVRVVTLTVFRMLSPHMTKPALQLILKVLTGEDEDALAFAEDDEEESEGEEEEEDDEESKDSGMEEEEDAKSNSSDDDSDDNNEVEAQVDETTRKTIKKTLGKAAADSEDEEGENNAGSDLDDDEMFKLDDALSAAFRAMMKNKKNSKEEKDKKLQLKNFKLKCLDLLNGFVTTDPAPSLAMELMFPLLELMQKGAQDKSMAEVAKRVHSVFNNLVSVKPVLTDPLVDQETLPDFVQKLIDFSAKVHDVPLVMAISTACLYVIRIMLGLESNSGPSPVRTRSRSVLKVVTPKKAHSATNHKYDQLQAILSESLDNFCLKRETHLNHMLFHTMFARQPSILWPQADKLAELMHNENVRVFCRTQVCGMLVVMINKETVQGIGEEAWTEFSHQMFKTLPEMLKKLNMDDLKPRFVHELLYLILKVASVSPQMEQLLTTEVIAKVNEVLRVVKKDTKIVCKKIIQLKQNQKKRKAKETDKVSPQKQAKMSNGDDEISKDSLSSPDSHDRITSAPSTEQKSGKKKKKRRSAASTELKEDKTDDQAELNKTPKKNLKLDLEEEAEEESKSARKKKKRRKSMVMSEEHQAVTSPGLDKHVGDSTQTTRTPNAPENINRTKSESSKSPRSGVTGNKTVDEPDGVGAGLATPTISPKLKMNRRKSTRLSIMTTTKGTPKS